MAIVLVACRAAVDYTHVETTRPGPGQLDRRLACNYNYLRNAGADYEALKVSALALSSTSGWATPVLTLNVDVAIATGNGTLHLEGTVTVNACNNGIPSLTACIVARRRASASTSKSAGAR